MEHANRQLAILKYKGKLVSAVLENKILDQVIVEDDDEQALRIGNIYVGRVSHIVSNINAAFVEVQKNLMCYLPLQEALPLQAAGKEKIVQGQEVVVQVKKAAVKKKQAVVTGKLEFAGEFVVVTTLNHTKSISMKITEEEVRSRLKELLSQYEDVPFGIILRTSCQEAETRQIVEDCERQIRMAEEILERARTRTCFTKVYEAEPEFAHFLRESGRNTFDRIITDESSVYELLKETEAFSEENIVLYEDESYSLDKLLGIGQKLEKALARHVWLKSGASLVIEYTEALTVIDVNSEKAIAGKQSSEGTFFKINLEAAREAARQIRVRNISGIILIDFIDMKKKEHIQALLQELENEFKKDKVKTTVVDITKLGLVEITRMKRRKPLWESLK